MTLNDYQVSALGTALPSADLTYCVLGLNGEAGEVAEKLKKHLRDVAPAGGALDVRGMALECGDVLWYLAVLADRLGLSLDQVAALNLEKLASRRARGVLGGSGDVR